MDNFTRPEYKLIAPTNKLILPESILKSPTANLTLPESKLKLPGQKSSGSYSHYVSTPETTEQVEKSTTSKDTKNTKAAYYSDPNDVNQVNSFLDVISKSFDPLENGGKIFSLATFADANKELFNRLIWQPIKQGDAKMALVNNLVNFGETVDVLANIVKAVLPTKITTAKNYSELQNSTAGERVKAALGINVQGRYAFDMDVNYGDSIGANIGEFATNLIGEFLVDPINWITFGLGTVVESGAKSATKEVLSEVGEATLKGIDTSTLAKQTAKAFLKGNADDFSEAFAKFAKKNLAANIAEETLKDNAALKALGKELFDQAEEIAAHKLSINILKATDSLVGATKKFDDILTKMAVGHIYYPSKFVINHIGKPVINYVASAIERTSKTYTVSHMGSNYGVNVLSISDVMADTKKLSGQLRLTKEVSEEIIQDMENASTEMISKSLSAQILRMSDIIYEADGEDALLDMLQKAVADFTKGQCKTVTDYLKVFSDALAKNPLLQTNIGEEIITNLNNIAEVENTIIKRIGKAELLNTFRDAVNPHLDSIDPALDEIEALLDFGRHSFDTDVVSGTMIDYMGSVFNDASIATKNAIDTVKELGEDMVLDHVTAAEKAIMDFQNSYAELAEALKNIDRDFILELGADEFDEFVSYASAKTRLMDSIQVLSDDIQKSIDSIKSAKQIKEVLDFKVAYTKRCGIISDIINSYSKGGVLSKVVNSIPDGTSYAQLGIDVAATKSSIKNMILDMPDSEGFIKYLNEKGIITLTEGSDFESELDILLNFDFKNAVDNDIMAYHSGVQNMIDRLQDYSNDLQVYRYENRIFDPNRFDADVLNKEVYEAALDEEWATINTNIRKTREIIRTLEDTINTKNMIFNDGKAWVAIRTEQFMNTIEMITGQLPNDLYNLFDTATEVGKRLQVFREALPATDELAMTLNALENQAIYMKYQRDFLERVMTKLPDKELWWSFNETLQNYGQIDPNMLFDDATKFSFISRMQLNLDSSYMLRSSSLDAYRKRLSNPEYKQFLIDNFGEENYIRMVDYGHIDPGSDVLMTKYAFLHDCQDQVDSLNTWLELNPGRKATFFDIETAEQLDLTKGSVNKYTGQTTQIALLDYETNEPIVIRLAELKDIYVEAPNVKNIIYIEGGEQDLYNYLDYYLKSNNVERLIGMNSNTFDVPFIKKRWSMNETAYYGSKFNSIITGSSDGHIDVYKSLRAAQGIPTLSHSDVETIYDLLQSYATDMIRMGYTTKVQSINPHNLVQNLNKVKRYIEINGQAMALYKDDLVVPYLENMYKLTDDYYNHISNKAWSTVFVRDLWKEKANVDTLNELADAIHQTPEYIQHLLLKDSILTDEELKILLKGDSTVPGFDVIQERASDWWRMRTLYYELSNPEETFEMFTKRILNGREEISNLRQLFTGVGERSYYNYRNIINDSYTKYFQIASDAPVHKKILKRIMNKSNEISSLINSRIKDEEAIFHIMYTDAQGHGYPLFKDFDDLKKQVQDIIHYTEPETFEDVETKVLNMVRNRQHIVPSDDIAIKKIKTENAQIVNSIELNNLKKDIQSVINNARTDYDTNTWLHYIDLDQFSTPKEYFALWYAIANETKYVNAGGLITASKNLSTLGDATGQIKQKIFKRINDNIFVDYSLRDLNARAAAGSPLIDMLQDEAWDTYNASQRIARLCEAIDNIPEAGAKEYAIRQISERMGRLAKRLDSMEDFDKRAYLSAFRNIESQRMYADSLNYLTHALDAETGADFIISDLLFNTPIKRIALPADGMIKYPTIEQQNYLDLAKALLNRQPELEAAGINMLYEDSTLFVYLNKAKATNIDFEKGIGMFNGKEYKSVPEDLIKLSYTSGIPNEDIDTINELLTFAANRSTYRGKGKVLTGSNYEQVFAALPKEVRDNMISINQLMSSKYFSELRFDTSEIGPSSLRRGMTVADPFNGYLKGYTYVLNSSSAQDLYVDMYFNPTNGMHLGKDGIFKGLSDEEIVEVLNKDDTFVVAYLVEDKSLQGYHVRRSPINNVRQLEIAREHNASLIPYQVYSNSFDEINNNTLAMYRAPKGIDVSSWTSEEIDAYIKKQPLYYLREVMYTYKLGYLTDPGTWGRNIIDSNMKAIIDTQDPIGMMKNTKKAMQQLKAYDDVCRLMIETNSNMHMNARGIKQFYKEAGEKGLKLALSEDEFFFIRGFITNGPSAGESKIITNWIKNKTGDTAQSMLSNIGNAMLSPMGYIESRVRLAEYMTLIEHGVTRTQAFEKVSKTAFDYNIKTNVDRMIEFVIPFYNFQKLNLNYWLRALGEHASLARTLDDITGVSWNTFNATAEDYTTNQSLQYHMLNGNIQLSDSGMVLKLNPSYIDVLNLLMNPKEEILNSTFAPLQNFIKYTFEEQEDIERQKQLLEGTYEIDFGKLKGGTVSDLITEENITYAQWLLTQDWFKDYKKPVYDYLMAHGVYNDPKMPIGKYKGMSMSNIPVNYKAYMLTQDWFVEKYNYIIDIWATNRDTVIPEEQIPNEPLLTPAEAEGLIASGIFTQGNNAFNHLQSIADKTLKDYSTYPIIGVLAQRYLEDDSTSKNNYQRLSEKQEPAQAIIAKILPGVFGAVKTYEEFKQDNEYYSTIPTKTTSETPYYIRNQSPYNYGKSRRYYPPSRSKNFYYTRRNKYRDARYFQQAQFTNFKIKQLRFNINKLSF